MIRNCKYSKCNKEFLPTRKDKVYCSKMCCKRDSAMNWAKEHPRQSAENKRIYQIVHKNKVEAARNKWKSENLDLHINVQRKSHLKRIFNITIEQYNELFSKQNGLCAICKLPQQDSWRNFCIDHDHSCCSGNKSCGKCIRGLLCQICNKNLGYLENIKWTDLAKVYLEKYKAKKLCSQ